MACKMLFFDFREQEEKFFKETKPDNYDIKFFKESLNELTVSNLSEDDLENTMIISIFSSSKITDNVVCKFKNLRLISTRSSGHDHINLDCCIRKNIALINVDFYGTKAVAQYTMGLMLMLVRKICPAIQSEINPLMPKNFCGRDLDVLTLGLFGTGTIGGAVCKYAHAFGMKILAYDTAPNRELVELYEVEYVKQDDLLKNSDIVVVLIPYTKDNYHKFSYDEFKQMKFGSYFINITRGEFVDNDALLDVAKTGKFKGIGLDVVACQNFRTPNNQEDEHDVTSTDCVNTSFVIKELMKLPNVIITPQIGYDTQESVDYILKTTFEGIGDFLKGGRKNRIF